MSPRAGLLLGPQGPARQEALSLHSTVGQVQSTAIYYVALEKWSLSSQHPETMNAWQDGIASYPSSIITHHVRALDDGSAPHTCAAM